MAKQIRKSIHKNHGWQDADAAISLIRRASYLPMFWHELLKRVIWTPEAKLKKAMEILDLLNEMMDEEAPDEDWLGEYYRLAGSPHMILTDEGWEPGEAKACYVKDDPTWVPLDEVNAPDTEPA